LQHLHTQNIIYRDLKPDNVGFTELHQTKLFDFGLAIDVSERERDSQGLYQLTGETGSMRYMAPEVALHLMYDQSVDVYSFGVLLWHFAALKVPFAASAYRKQHTQYISQGNRPPLDSSWPYILCDIIENSWSTQSSRRPNFTDIISILNEVVVSIQEDNVRRTSGLFSRGKVKEEDSTPGPLLNEVV